MADNQRAFDFEGGDKQYITFLENWLKSLLSERSSNPIDISRENANQRKATSGTALRSSKQQQLAIIPYRHHGKRRSPKQLQQWQRQLIGFQKGIPALREWDKFRSERALSTERQNKAVINALLKLPLLNDLIQPANIVSAPSHSLSYGPWVQSFYSYACETADLKLRTKMASKLGFFRELIVVSNCVVMEHLNIAPEDIESIMKACVSETGSSNLLEYRRGAAWVNKCISKLSECGWGHRSSEIFLLCGRAVSYYSRIARSSISFGSLISGLQSSESPIPETSGWVPLSIPCIIKHLSGNHISLKDICEALHYNYDNTACVYDKHYLRMEETPHSTYDPILFDGPPPWDPIFDMWDPVF